MIFSTASRWLTSSRAWPDLNSTMRSLSTIGSAGLGVAVRAGAPKPGISSVEAFKRTLLNAKSVAFPGKGASGIYFTGLLDRLGIAEAMKPKLKSMTAEATVEVVARGEAKISIQAHARRRPGNMVQRQIMQNFQ